MEKRGQVTIFIILGLILLITVGFFLFTRTSFLEGPSKAGNVEQQLRLELSQIEEEIDRCVKEETDKITKEVLATGGSLENSNFLPYKGMKVSILCQNIPEQDSCLASPLIKSDVEQRVQAELQEKVSECIDLSPYRGQDYQLTTGDFELELQINSDNILVRVDYPITLQKEDVTVKKGDFTEVSQIPLGTILQVANDILQDEAGTGTFDPIRYTTFNLNRYLVEVKKPYPDKIYNVRLRDSPDHIMWFAVTADGRYESVL